MYACKLGIRTALSDISSNHPNDLVSLIFFSTPRTSNSDTFSRFNRVRVGLSRNYSNMQDALWYPPATIGNGSQDSGGDSIQGANPGPVTYSSGGTFSVSATGGGSSVMRS